MTEGKNEDDGYIRERGGEKKGRMRCGGYKEKEKEGNGRGRRGR